MTTPTFTGLNHTQRAASHIASAIELLRESKYSLLQAKSDQHIHVDMNLGSLEEILGTLRDPECTPEIAEGVGMNAVVRSWGELGDEQETHPSEKRNRSQTTLLQSNWSEI